eukprot:7943678-Pyramimonas_sp.AAC.1
MSEALALRAGSGFNNASKHASVMPSSELLPIFVIASVWQPAWEKNWSTCRAEYARDSPLRHWTDNLREPCPQA